MRRIANHKVKGKRVLVRVDFNCPVENGQITSDVRIRAHAETIKDLSERGARVIVLSHQGRKGRDDFLNLEQHAKRLHDILKKDVIFVDDVVGKRAIHAIEKLENGQILVLDNVRNMHCETEHPDGQGEIVYHLSSLADYFVLDALSVAHRKHSSIVGFKDKIPCFAGNVLAAEVDAVDKIKKGTDVTFIFGGSKANDSFAVMDKWLSEGRAKEILVGGALSVLLLYANGHSIGDSIDYLKDSGLEEKVPAAKQMLEKFDGKIVLPVDVGLSIKKERLDLENETRIERQECDVENVKEGQIWDIGEKTIERYKEVINNSHFIVLNGPIGVYEVDDFSKGTKAILEAIANCDAFSLLGGGHTLAALEKFNIDKKYFGYVSLSGKALIKYLCGKELVGLLALEENEKKFPSI
ncbi:phosphoglycerate kinase [Candidatus Micrarchaeota archaeon]|nr:phosphoglycerate kinase [Candidatus Micrarchaeota archaeon]